MVVDGKGNGWKVQSDSSHFKWLQKDWGRRDDTCYLSIRLVKVKIEIGTSKGWWHCVFLRVNFCYVNKSPILAENWSFSLLLVDVMKFIVCRQKGLYEVCET